MSVEATAAALLRAAESNDWISWESAVSDRLPIVIDRESRA